MKSMKDLSVKGRVYLILILVLILATCISLTIWLCNRDEEPVAVPEEIEDILENPDNIVEYHEDGTVLSEETTISTQVIEEGLRNMGKLITQEYYFTEIANYSNQKEFLGFNMPWTETCFIIGYNGKIQVGIDFTKISVEKNDENKEIKIILNHVEKPQINDVILDTEKYELYYEKHGIGNSLNIQDLHKSFNQVKETALKKALDSEMLDSADKNAKLLIENFIAGLIGGEYQITFNYI